MINTIIIYIIFNFIVLLICGKISYKLNLVDLPNKRKIHSTITAYTGGISISIILLFAVILFDNFNPSLSLILSIGFLISIVGLIDDKYTLNIGGKLSLQIIPIFYLIVIQNFYLNHLGDYYYFKLELGTFALPFTLNQIGDYGFFNIDLGAFTIPFTFLSVLFLINSFNYFDGIDGMLGCTSISVLAILYFLASENNNHILVTEQNIKLFIIVIIIPIAVFLFFNFSFLNLPKLFLGDGGSLLLGFIISFILIYFANKNFIHPILLAWSVVIFVYEFLSINIIRLKNNQGLFKAGKDHLHHILIRKTKSVFLTNFIMTTVNISLFSVGYYSLLLINELASLIMFIVFFIFFLIIRDIFSKK